MVSYRILYGGCRIHGCAKRSGLLLLFKLLLFFRRLQISSHASLDPRLMDM